MIVSETTGTFPPQSIFLILFIKSKKSKLFLNNCVVICRLIGYTIKRKQN